jgi:LPPG:FO 2-phospho-L-lactate transferase
VLYTLSGRHAAERGWGVAGKSFRHAAALVGLVAEAWFNLGDLDLAAALGAD